MSAVAPHVEQFKVVQNPGEIEEHRDEKLEARLIKEVQNYYDLTKPSRPRRYYLQLLADLFSKGIHYIDYSPQRGVVEEWSAEKVSSCMYTPIPLLQYAVEVIAAQYTTSNGRAVPMPTDTSDPKVKAVVRSLQDYADYLDWDFYHRDPAQRQLEAKLIPLRGVYNFLEYDKNAGPKIQIPQYAPKMAQVCADCGYEIGAQDAGLDVAETAGGGGVPVGGDDPMAPPAGSVCSHCGSSNITEIASGVAAQGQIEAHQGAIKRNVVDSFQVEIDDRRRGIEESKHLIYDEILYKTEAKKAYPWLKSVTGSASLGNYEHGFLGLHYLTQLQTLIANTGKLDQSNTSNQETRYGTVSSGYRGSYLHDKKCWRRRCWFDAEVYSDWTINEPTQLPGTDQVVPAGTKVSALFPDGMCIHIVNGDSVVQIENQNKNAVWSYVGYRVPSTGMHGTGVNSLVALVRGNDEAHSIGMQALLMAALGIVIADERVPRVENVPGRVLTIPIDANPMGQPLSNFAARIDMGGGAVIQAAEPIKQAMRGIIGDMAMAPNPQGAGLRPDNVGGDTATAVRYNAGATGTLTSPVMEVYAAHRALVIQQAVALERLHNLRPRLYGKAGETAAKWFQPMQIPEDMKFGVAEQSWRPRTMESQREDIGAAISLGVGTGNIADPQIEEKARRVFGLDDETDGYDDWAILAEQRLDALKAALPAMEQEIAQVEQELQTQPMPMKLGPDGQPIPAYDPVTRLIEMAEAAPRPLDMPGHTHYARFWVEKYQSDEFRTYPPILQQAIEKLFLMAQQGIGQAGAVQTEIQVQTQQPAIQAQQEQQMASQAAQQEAQEGQESKSQEASEGERKHEAVQGAVEHGRSITAEEAKHKRAVELEKMKHEHALEIEKVRANNRPKAGGKKR